MSFSKLFTVGAMSRIFGNVIRNIKNQHEHIGIHIDPDTTQLLIGGHFLGYPKLKVALKDLGSAMSKPKFHSDSFGLRFSEKKEREAEKVLNFIESFNPICVKTVYLADKGDNDVLPFLQCFKAGMLEEIQINHWPKIDMSQIVKTDQWKQAKEVSMGEHTTVPFDDCLHFNRFNIALDSFSTEEALRIQDILSKSANFENCLLSMSIDPSSIIEIGRNLGATPDSDDDVEYIIHRHPIPNSNDFLVFVFHSYGFVRIEKISR